MKKLFAGLCAGVLAVALMGCGGEPKEPVEEPGAAPTAPVKDAPAKDAAWRANFCRDRYAKDKNRPEYSSWSPTMGSYHRPKRFGKLKFK